MPRGIIHRGELGQIPGAGAALVAELEAINAEIASTNRVVAAGDLDVAKTTAGNVFSQGQYMASLGVGMASGITGVLNVAGKVYERGRTVAIGDWISPSYSAAYFTSSGAGGWLVEGPDMYTYAYTLIGETMLLSVVLLGTSVLAAAGTNLFVRIPGGLTSQFYSLCRIRLYDNGIERVDGYAQVAPGGTLVTLATLSGTTFGAGAHTTSIQFQMFFKVA